MVYFPREILLFSLILNSSLAFSPNDKMLSSVSRMTARGLPRRSLLALSADTTAKRTMADVEVEHGRGQWQTYGDVDNYKQGKYQIKTFNKISPIGLGQFPEGEYDIRSNDAGDEAKNAHAILLRSHKLQEDEVPKTVRAIAR